MSNPLDKVFVGEDKFSEKMDNVVMALLGISAGQGGHVQITTWKQIQQVVRMGLARKFFSVGDQFIVPKESAITVTSSNSGLSLSINAHTFIEKMGEAGNVDYECEYDGIEWHDGDKNIVLSQYGITINSGTPQAGDKIVVHETATDIIFEVMGFDQEKPVESEREHSMTLGMKYTFDGIVFDAREAFFVNRTSDSIPAGTYNFKLKDHSWMSADQGKYFQFTLANDLPVGGQLVFQQGYNATLVGASVKVFSSNAKKDSEQTEIVTLSEGQGGTYLGELKNGLDLESADNYQKCFNHSQRAIMGSNRYSTSAIRQWITANAPKGTFWQPTNVFDRQPSWHDTSSGKDGFLYNLDPELVSVLGKCKKEVELATCDRYTSGGSTVTKEVVEDIAWLFDRYEIQSCSAAEAVTNPPYEYWHLLLGETYGDWRTDTRFIKTNKSGSAQYWWLRSPYTGNGYDARNVYNSGYVNDNIASNGYQAVVVFAII